MKITANEKSVIIKDLKHFNPTHTFECGQCFRWDKTIDGSYIGIAYNKLVDISFKDDICIIKNTNLDDFNAIWKNYLDLDTDYGKIKSVFSKDENVKKAMDYGWGIRILNQELFECLISFIISTQNQIPRIKKIVASLSEVYGEKIEYEGKIYYSFPTLESLSGIKENDLAPFKMGYRQKYIIDAINKISSGEVDLGKVKTLPYLDAKNELMKINGVGPKVADCVLLFSLGKKEAFPIDVWVKRTMRKLYLNENSTIKEIEKFSKDYFGEFSGVAQQYLFYYARENKL